MSQQHVPKLDYFSGQGNILAANRDPATGRPMGFKQLGDTNLVTLAIATTNNVIREGFTGKRGEVVRYATDTSVSLTVNLQSLDPVTMEFGTQGSSQVTAEATDLDVTLIIDQLDAIYRTGHIALDPVKFTLLSSDSSITYEEGKNYSLDDRSGSIDIFSDAKQTELGAVSNIIAGQGAIAKVDAPETVIIHPLTESRKQVVFLFEGLNRAKNDEPVILTVSNADFDPVQTMEMWTETAYTVMTMEASALFDRQAVARGESPYYQIQRLPVDA